MSNADEIENIVEQVGMILEKLDNGEYLKPDDIKYIPLNVLKVKMSPLQLERHFSLLSEQKRKKLQLYLPCHEHYNRSDDDHIDGPPPPIRNCYVCMKLSNFKQFEFCKKKKMSRTECDC